MSYAQAHAAYRDRLADSMANLKALSDSDLSLLFLRFGDAGEGALTERETRVLTACMTEMTMRFPRLAEENETLLTELQELYGAEDRESERQPHDQEEEA